MSVTAFPKFFLPPDPFRFRKIATDSHILADVNIECPDERYPKLNIYFSELILGSHEYTTVAYVTIHCIIRYMIYLLTSIGLTPGGSSTVHIYTQTIHRTTQITTE